MSIFWSKQLLIVVGAQCKLTNKRRDNKDSVEANKMCKLLIFLNNFFILLQWSDHIAEVAVLLLIGLYQIFASCSLRCRIVGWISLFVFVRIVMLDQIHAALFTGIKYWHQQDERFWRPSPQGGSWSLQLSETGMKDPQEDPLAVYCFCVCSGSVLLGDLLGVSRSRERDLMSVLSIYPRILLCVFIVYRHIVRILCLLLYSAICWCVLVALV